MNATLLVLHRHADRFKHALAQEFPGVSIIAATTRDEAIPLAGGAQAIVALDSQFCDAMAGAAPDLACGSMPSPPAPT